MEPESRQVLIDQANLIVIAAMSSLWGAAVLVFWLQVFGPLLPTGTLAPPRPSVLGWLFWFALSFAPCLLPSVYFQPRALEIPLDERLGVRLFRRFATNGDLINRWVRRHDPTYHVLRGRASLAAHIGGTYRGQIGHAVLLLMGAWTAVYVARIGWMGWALYVAVSNILFNLYPILLQRYTRACLTTIIMRHRRRS